MRTDSPGSGSGNSQDPLGWNTPRLEPLPDVRLLYTTATSQLRLIVTTSKQRPIKSQKR